jgi:uncharacterized protein (TIGR02594 family)
MNYMQMYYPWIIEARKHLGLKEIPGPKHNTTILGWLESLKAWWRDDETPWCGTYVGHCFRVSGMRIPKMWMRAKEWSNDWGFKLTKPVPGCVVVFDRVGGGHVGFFLGYTSNKELVVLGGNQSNMVNIAKFSPDRLIGYYWPKDFEPPNYQTVTIPILTVSGPLSVNEA